MTVRYSDGEVALKRLKLHIVHFEDLWISWKLATGLYATQSPDSELDLMVSHFKMIDFLRKCLIYILTAFFRTKENSKCCRRECGTRNEENETNLNVVVAEKERERERKLCIRRKLCGIFILNKMGTSNEILSVIRIHYPKNIAHGSFSPNSLPFTKVILAITWLWSCLIFKDILTLSRSTLKFHEISSILHIECVIIL